MPIVDQRVAVALIIGQSGTDDGTFHQPTIKMVLQIAGPRPRLVPDGVL